MKNSTIEKGSPVMTTALCSVDRPPASSSDRVRPPITADHRIRIQMGASLLTSLSLEVKFDRTRAPESPEVMKNTIARILTATVVMTGNGYSCRNR